MPKAAIDKKWIKDEVKSGSYELCVAAELERQAEKISLAVLEKTLVEGKILEKFPKDPRGPSFIVARKGAKSLHAMCAMDKDRKLRVLAVYHPAHPKWSPPPAPPAKIKFPERLKRKSAGKAKPARPKTVKASRGKK